MDGYGMSDTVRQRFGIREIDSRIDPDLGGHTFYVNGVKVHIIHTVTELRSKPISEVCKYMQVYTYHCKRTGNCGDYLRCSSVVATSSRRTGCCAGQGSATGMKCACMPRYCPISFSTPFFIRWIISIASISEDLLLDMPSACDSLQIEEEFACPESCMHTEGCGVVTDGPEHDQALGGGCKRAGTFLRGLRRGRHPCVAGVLDHRRLQRPRRHPCAPPHKLQTVHGRRSDMC